MRRAVVASVVAIAIATAAPTRARADDRRVQVVEIAGDVAYVEPGEGAGLAVGSVVRFGRKRLTVVGVTREHAAVRLDGARLDVGARGTATVTAGATAGAIAARPAPRALDAYRAQWPDPRRPADTQTPRAVPLGAGTISGALRAALWGSGMAALDGEDATYALEAGARVSYQPWRERPLAADLDVAARLFSAGRRGARAPLQVRAAQLRWGPAADPRLAIGRLRWASTSTGMLDGARVAAHVGPVELAAFGGLVPEALDGPVVSTPRRLHGAARPGDLLLSAGLVRSLEHIVHAPDVVVPAIDRHTCP
jgi:hypothetical protein